MASLFLVGVSMGEAGGKEKGTTAISNTTLDMNTPTRALHKMQYQGDLVVTPRLSQTVRDLITPLAFYMIITRKFLQSTPHTCCARSSAVSGPAAPACSRLQPAYAGLKRRSSNRLRPFPLPSPIIQIQADNSPVGQLCLAEEIMDSEKTKN